MNEREIDLVFFEGCPNADQARRNIRDALRASGSQPLWREWDLSVAATPSRFRGFGSPSVLVDGDDVTGPSGANAAMACRADGAPGTGTILMALRSNGGGT
jgi:hypothetical protein